MLREKDKQPYAVVLGLAMNGLSAARSLGRKGIRVIAHERHKPCGTTHSRYVYKYLDLGPNPSEDALLKKLLEIGSHHSAKIFLFPTNDYFVLFVSKHREALNRFYAFALTDRDSLDRVIGKATLYAMAAKHGIPHPVTRMPHAIEDVERIADEICYPCYVKPVFSHIWAKAFPGIKLLCAKDRDELLRYARDAYDKQVEIMVQEIIPGDDTTIYSAMALMDRESQPIATCEKRKIRQYPVGTGSGCFQESIDHPQLRDLAVRFLRNIKYVGPACVEFRWDRRDNTFKLMEINARTELGQELFTRAGVDIPYLTYAYVMRGKREIPAGYKEGVRWFYFEHDFQSFLTLSKQGKLNFLGWIWSLRTVNVGACFAWDDPLPFVFRTTRFLYRLFLTLFRKVGHALAGHRGRPAAQNRKPPALILGSTITALSCARSLGRRGITAAVLDRSVRPPVVASSRYVKSFIRLRQDLPEEALLEEILRIGKSNSGRTFLLPTNDYFVLFVSRNRRALGRCFSFALPDHDTVERIMNKRLLYASARKFNVPHPRTFTPATLEELENQIDAIPLPCFLKPVYPHIWRDRFPDLKVMEMKSKDELRANFKALAETGLETVIQEIIPGPDDAFFCVAAYLDEHHRPLGICTVRKHRQYPMHKGIGSLQSTVHAKELEEQSVGLLGRLGYVGPACSVEFKRDSRDGVFKLIEINARPELEQELITQAGVDIPYMAYAHTLYGCHEFSSTVKAGLKWMCFEWDLQSFAEAWRRGEISMWTWIKSIMGVRVFGYFSWSDPLPFVYASVLLGRRAFIGIVKRAAGRRPFLRNEPPRVEDKLTPEPGRRTTSVGAGE